MPHLAAARQCNEVRTARSAGWTPASVALALLALLVMLALHPAQAQGVDVQSLAATRDPDAVAVEYQLRVTLPRAAEEAAQRGIPLYFAAQATLFRSRWYWRDERVARAVRQWRLSYQPLTSTWRISQGGLGQNYPSLDEALASITKSTGWRIAEAAAIDGESRYYVEFSWALDTAQLPRPLQIGLTGAGAASEWALGIERSLKLPTDTK